MKPGLLIAGLDISIEFLKGFLAFFIEEFIDCHLQQLKIPGIQVITIVCLL